MVQLEVVWGLCTQDSREGASAIAPNIHKNY